MTQFEGQVGEVRPVVESLLEFASRFGAQDLTARTQHLEVTVMTKATVLELMTAQAPLLQKLMDSFGLKFDLRVVRNVDDAIIEVLRIIDKEFQKEEEKQETENPEAEAVEVKEKN